MAIIQKHVNAGSNQTTWVVQCEMCKREAKKSAWEPGDADLLARKEGFGVIFTSAEEPGNWYCPDCLAKLTQADG